MAPLLNTTRRRRYTRQSIDNVSLTPLKATLLRQVAEYGVVSLPQLARLSCPSEKSARRHLRELFDAGLVDVVPVPRAALAEGTDPNDAGLMFGSAPNIYTVTKLGIRSLRERDLIDDLEPPPSYGPKNSLFLAHTLAIRDVRVWLELAAREHPNHRLERWADGGSAEIDLERPQSPKVVRPDAWFVYRLGARFLVGLVEVDRGTERGLRRWTEKLTAYDRLFAGGRLVKITGYVNARVLVITPDASRREALASQIASGATPELANRFWLADRSVLSRPDLTQSVWRGPDGQSPRPLIPTELIDLHIGG